jgi:hypothetical protein
MLTDEERTEILSIHSSGSLYDLSLAIERAVLAKAMPMPKQEPVAWMNNQGETTINEVQVEYWEMGGYKITPLYTDPQPAQAAAMPTGYSIEWRDNHVIVTAPDNGQGLAYADETLYQFIKSMLSASPKPE